MASKQITFDTTWFSFPKENKKKAANDGGGNFFFHPRRSGYIRVLRVAVDQRMIHLEQRLYVLQQTKILLTKLNICCLI